METKKRKKYSIAVDFDGVIHQYTTKQGQTWDPTFIPDPPMPGAFEWLEVMIEHFNVVIYSARLTPRGETEADWADAQDALTAMKGWFLLQGMKGCQLGKLTFWQNPGKPTALVYIDDRGYRFQGEFPDKQEIYRLRPWKIGTAE